MKHLKVKLTAYVQPGPLRMLALVADSASLNFGLGCFASLVAERGRLLAKSLSAAQWEVLRDALDEDCWEMPTGGTSWSEVIRSRLEERMGVSVSPAGKLRHAAMGLEGSLLAAMDKCDELDAVAIITAVRHCEQSGSVEGPAGKRWWEPADRIGRAVLPATQAAEPEPKASKRKRK